MKEVLLIGLKALAGGTLVVAFAVLSDALKPKTFAGLFSAAPSVAVASLGVTTIAFGTGKAAQAAGAMVAGAIGLVAFCAAAMVLERRVGALTSSAVAWLAWFVAAGAASWALLR
ncbi:MAG: DUF3147 family protein [Chloroflexi bacterium]|nr:MAG: DUF3147 family protein [Chloroflexota bacterium]TME08039.1 MAG: DUF3147 family protein [Chloroflexota bacterium]